MLMTKSFLLTMCVNIHRWLWHGQVRLYETMLSNEPYRSRSWIHHPQQCILGLPWYFGQWRMLHFIASISHPATQWSKMGWLTVFCAYCRHWFSSRFCLCHIKCCMFCCHWMVEAKWSILETKGTRRYPTWRRYTFADGSRRTTFLVIESWPCF